MATFMRIYKIVVSIVASIAIVMVIMLLGVRIFGITPYTVLSGSMEPTYHVGSVIYVKDAEAEELKVGDPITFDLKGVTVTHRIIEKADDEQGVRFYTQGDANNVRDGGFVTPEEVIGIPVFHIPYMGFIFDFVQHPPGIFIVLGFVGALVVLSFLQTNDENEHETEAADEVINDEVGEDNQK